MPAFFMSHLFCCFLMVFQVFSAARGNSTRHGRNMHKPDDRPFIGEDGLPTDPDDLCYRPEDWLFHEHMKSCEAAWRAGVTAAAVRALGYCRDYGHPPRDWLVAAIAKIARAKETPGEAKRRERDAVHYTRWDAVVELRDRRDEFALRGDARAATWDNVFEAVSELLEGTEAAGGPDAVRRSYELVKRDMDAGLGSKYF